MRRKIVALIGVLCLMLSACGGEQQRSASSDTASVPAVGSSTEAAEAAVESVKSSLETGAEAPQDPVELGRWLWSLNEEKNQENYAVDYDVEMSLALDMDGESTTEKVSGRVRQIENQDGTVIYQSEEQYLNAVTTTWYADGMVYLSEPYGDYKAPMDLDAFREQVISDGSSDLMELSVDDFGTLTGEITDSGYVLTYGDVALEAWMAFSEMLDGMLEGVDGGCEQFELSGTVTLDRDGNMLRHEMKMEVSFDVLGVMLTEHVDMTQSVNSYNESVTISVPVHDDAFVDMSDIQIPSLFADGFNGTLAQNALHYEDTMTLSISDPAGGIADTYVQQDTIAYFLAGDGLHVVWDTSTLMDGEVVNWSNDSYVAGSGTFTDNTGESQYTYDDGSFGEDIAAFVTLYADSFDAGNHYQLTQEGSQRVLTFDIDEDYISSLLSGNLSSFGTGVDYDEATEANCRGTMTVWFDGSGLMVSQLLDVTAELTYETGVISVAMTDRGDVLAMGDDVTVSGAGY